MEASWVKASDRYEPQVAAIEAVAHEISVFGPESIVGRSGLTVAIWAKLVHLPTALHGLFWIVADYSRHSSGREPAASGTPERDFPKNFLTNSPKT